MITALTPGQKTKRVVLRQVMSRLNYAEKTKIDTAVYRFAKHACHRIVFKELARSNICDLTVDVL